MDETRRRFASDLEMMRSIIRRLPDLDGVEIQMGDGIVMISPVRPVHSTTARRLTNQIEPQLPKTADVAVNNEVEFSFPDWDKDYTPDVMIWEGQADRDNLSRGTADLLTFVCEVVSPSSVENDYAHRLRDYAVVPTIEAYLIADPYLRAATLHTNPQNGRFLNSRIIPYGDSETFQLSFGPITVDTADLPSAPPEERREEWPALAR